MINLTSEQRIEIFEFYEMCMHHDGETPEEAFNHTMRFFVGGEIPDLEEHMLREIITDNTPHNEPHTRYAVIMRGTVPSDGLHRGPWSEQKARQWVKESEEMGFPAGAFEIVKSDVTPWVREDGSVWSS